MRKPAQEQQFVRPTTWSLLIYFVCLVSFVAPLLLSQDLSRDFSVVTFFDDALSRMGRS